MHMAQGKKMPEKKKFLIVAIGVGVVGIIIGGITIWSMVQEITNP